MLITDLQLNLLNNGNIHKPLNSLIISKNKLESLPKKVIQQMYPHLKIAQIKLFSLIFNIKMELSIKGRVVAPISGKELEFYLINLTINYMKGNGKMIKRMEMEFKLILMQI